MLDISVEDYNIIAELVKAGKYPSTEVFTELAIKNQLTLERSQGYRPLTKMITEKPIIHSNDSLRKPFNQEPQLVQPIFLAESRRMTPIWGLINRFAPSKIVLRLLANSLIVSKSDWIDFKQFSEEAVTVASQIRLQIQKYEKKSNMVRGESLYVGLPQKDPKSQQRFVNIYVGRLRGEDLIDGLLGDLQLATIRRNQYAGPSGLTIGITEAGLKWANLRSPLIDDFVLGQQPVQNPLSEEEVHFLLKYLKTVRPGEYEFLNFLYTAIKMGSNTPQKIANAVSKYFAKQQYTDTLLNTMQTGGLARLVEMRLARIDKKGIYTTYRIQTSAEDLDELTSVDIDDSQEDKVEVDSSL